MYISLQSKVVALDVQQRGSEIRSRTLAAEQHCEILMF